MMAFEAQDKEARPLGRQVSWPKPKYRVFGGFVNEAIQFGILESSRSNGVQNNNSSRQEIFCWTIKTRCYGIA